MTYIIIINMVILKLKALQLSMFLKQLREANPLPLRFYLPQFGPAQRLGNPQAQDHEVLQLHGPPEGYRQGQIYD